MIKALGKVLFGLVVIAVAVALVFAVSNAYVLATTQDDIVDEQTAASFDADAIVVLGASVYADGTPSKILQDRLDDAISLYFAGAAPKIIMSGDNGTDSYNECGAMKRYAVSQGVPSEDVFCDHAGYSTYETMYRAHHVFGAQRVVVATQSYHLYRAVFDAQGVGMQAIGVPSDYANYSRQAWYDLREIFARTKDVFQVLVKAEPTVMSEPVSLDQSGDVTNW